MEPNINKFKDKYLKYIIYAFYFVAMFSFFVPGQHVPIVFPIRKFVPIVGIMLILLSNDIKFDIKRALPFLFLYVLASANGIRKEDMVMIGILATLFRKDFKRFMLFNFLFLFFYLIITTTLSSLGILHNIVFSDWRGLRQGFFFNHPNLFGMATLSCLATLFYLCIVYKNKYLNIFYILVSSFATFFLDNVVKTRMNTYVILFLLFLFIIYLISQKYKKVDTLVECVCKLLPILFILTPFVILICSILFSFNLDILHKLNGMLSGRFSLQNKAISNYGIPIFGRNISFPNGQGFTTYDVIDSGFMSYIFNYGFVFFYYLLYLLTRMSHKINLYSTGLFISAIVFCLSGITENLIFCFVHNPFIVILVSQYLFNDSVEESPVC